MATKYKTKSHITRPIYTYLSGVFALLSRVTLASAGLSCTNEHAGQLLVGSNALWPTQPKFWVFVAYRGVAHSAHAAAHP